jgi:hypothetical protein
MITAFEIIVMKSNQFECASLLNESSSKRGRNEIQQNGCGRNSEKFGEQERVVHTPKGLDMGTNEDLCTLPAIPEP